MGDSIRVHTDPAGNIKRNKQKPAKTTDGVVATIMGVDSEMRRISEPKVSTRHNRGPLVVRQ